LNESYHIKPLRYSYSEMFYIFINEQRQTRYFLGFKFLVIQESDSEESESGEEEESTEKKETDKAENENQEDSSSEEEE